MRFAPLIALGLIGWGLGLGCGGESSSKNDAGTGGTAKSGAGGATAGAEATAATGGGSVRAGAGGVAGATGLGGGAGNAATAGRNAGPGGGNAGVGGAGTGGGSGRGGSAGVLGDAGVPSAGDTGTAGAHELPTKDGLPIGDCTDPTPEELAASGCPPELESMAPCTEIGAICRTEIRTDAPQSSSQGYFTCQEDGQLNVGALLTCGLTCEVSAGNDAVLDATDCSSRPVTECDTSDVTYAVPALAQQKADRELDRVIQACGGFPIDNRIEVKLLNGCPYALSTTPTLSSSIVDCLKYRLSQVRWSCAEDLMCASWAQFFM